MRRVPLSRNALFLALVALAAFVRTPAAPASPLFQAPFRALRVGGTGQYVTSADLDGDGIPDLITADQYADENGGPADVRVAMGTGNGQFAAVHTYTPSAYGSEPAIAELTGDGHLDIATANYSDGHVYILPGLGDGSFGPPIPFDTAYQCYAVVVADLNLDGHNDIVASSWLSVAVRLGSGGGVYAPATTYVTASNTFRIAVGLLNADAYPDIVTSDGLSISVLMGVGNGTFQAYDSLSCDNAQGDLVVADVTGDGKTDIVIGGDGGIHLFPGVGDGTFGVRQDIAVARASGRLAVADLNADSHLDIVVGAKAANGQGVMTVLYGNGSGGFPTRVDVLTLYGASGVWAGDLDDDGHADLVTANTDGAVALHSGTGSSFGFVRRYVTGSEPIANALADIDGDGHADLAVAQHGAASIAVRLGAGDGTFGIRRDFETGPDPPQVLTLGDLDGDGHADVVMADSWDTGSSIPGHVWVMRGFAGGAFGSITSTTTGVRLSGVAIGDLDEDHHDDVVVSDRVANRVSVLRNSGTGALQPPVHFGAGDGASGVALGDLDNDGHLDAVVANRTAGTVTILFGDGHGAFVRESEWPAAAGCRAVAIGMLDGDLMPDLVTANETDGSIAILKGLGNGAFGLPTLLPAGGTPVSVGIANLDAGPAPDIVVGYNSGSPSPYYLTSLPATTVGVLIGMGAGVFKPLQLFGAGAAPEQVAFADLDGSGALDLVTADRLSNSTTVLLNTTSTVGVTPHDPVAGLQVGRIFPNPVFASVSIPFAIGNESAARIRIYDAAGRVVRTLVDRTLPQGSHVARWDRVTDAGTRAGAGVYFYELRAAGRSATGRIVLL